MVTNQSPKVGARVRISSFALQKSVSLNYPKGKVINYSKSGYILVLRDNTRQPTAFSPDFWEEDV